MPQMIRVRAAREVGAGIRTVLGGFRVWGADPRAMLLGLIPGAVSLLVLSASVATVVASADGLGDSIGHRIGGDGWLGDALAIAVAIAVVAAGALVAVAVFTALTLAIGQPFFEAISRRVDGRHDAAAASGAATVSYVEPDEHWSRTVVRGLGEGLLTIAISLGVSLALFLVGLVPIAGSPVAFTAGVLIGGRLLAIELTAYPFSRRGIVTRRERIAALRPYRVRTVAFGAASFLLFLIPLGAVLTMPVAIAGATLLVRDVAAGPGAAPRGDVGLVA